MNTKQKTDAILSYLISKYDPNTIMLYGSFNDGSDDENSDFDVLVICDNCVEEMHDSSLVDGTVLDAFIYSTHYFDKETKYEDFMQVFDATILIDKYGIGERLKNSVILKLEEEQSKSYRQNLSQVEWCEKMLLRTKRGDAEGYYRWHWVLIDSLEIYFNLRKKPFLGAKKALKYLSDKYPQDMDVYYQAITSFKEESLENWVKILRKRLEEHKDSMEKN